MTIQEMFGIELPIIQAPMAGVQDHELAVAVSNAGGLGSLPCAMLDVEGLKRELTALTSKTDKPYNVNFFCHTPPAHDSAIEGKWRATLLPYFEELGVELSSIQTGAGRSPFSPELLSVLAQFKPPVVSFHFGLPAPLLIAQIKAWGGKVLSSATTVQEALWLERHGVDAIIAQGLEAGGHRGFFLDKDITTQVGTFALLPQIVDAVSIPVIAAGGIADAKGVQAAMSLGAAGVQVGTAYLLCHEAKTSPMHRDALQSERASSTALTNIFSGGAARGIVNRVMAELGPISAAAPAFPLASAALAPLRAAAEAQGSGEFSPLWAGQNVSGCAAVSAAELTRSLVGP
ncbi:NAD(P)H-dependent flavin oxidoreductase [Marinomonas fungiae]|uniref:Nitronate monooxygenase n=1 Tax=Marinomonas fungiae TaxID=1137284 RepID=A0A0K6IL62_9GAMM|nr:nitronate monooxygenase [Marinomonas fungiae]CUB03824.1 NAD(P)H-dependent flavin oxidoreductase YrpB, nitropropane dioxygenase family [Marinomonas fungiae]